MTLSGSNFCKLPSWFPGTTIVLISFPISKNRGTAPHSIFEIESIPDLISPSRTSESTFWVCTRFWILACISRISSFGSMKISFEIKPASNPICKSVITRWRCFSSSINAGCEGINHQSYTISI